VKAGALGLESPVLPPGFWEEPHTLDALAQRDIGTLFRQVRRLAGASQTQIGIATGMSQAQVSEIMSGGRRVTSVDVLVRIVEGLRMPPAASSLLFLGTSNSHPVTADQPVGTPATATVSTAPGLASGADRHSDVVAVFPTRSHFTSAMPPHTLFDGASRIRAAGLSLNVLCQQYGDRSLLNLIETGARLQCLFLDPDGGSILTREREEGHARGHLASLTRLNTQTMMRVRERAPDEVRDAVEIATYDETLRVNITLVDENTCVVQPYLPEARGVDSPTFVLDRTAANSGLHQTFEQIFESLWQRRRSL